MVLAELRLILFATIGVTIMFIVRNHSVNPFMNVVEFGDHYTVLQF